jgi:hypothetical protein
MKGGIFFDLGFCLPTLLPSFPTKNDSMVPFGFTVYNSVYNHIITIYLNKSFKPTLRGMRLTLFSKRGEGKVGINHC